MVPGEEQPNVTENLARKLELTLRLSTFEVPPIQDALVIGREAPVGIEGARRMVDAITPGQFEVLKLEHPDVEAVVIRKNLLKCIPGQRLADLLAGEFARLATPQMILKVQIHIVGQVSLEMNLA